jgi:hypothetical protein
VLRIEAQPVDVIALNPAALVMETRLAATGFGAGKACADRSRRCCGGFAGHALPGCLAGNLCRARGRWRLAGQTLQSRRPAAGVFCRTYRPAAKGSTRGSGTSLQGQEPAPWYENLLSATPTLEMGVDIGDLSSVLLCSVPPNQASYLQRIGRAGRRDGNAFTATLADGASPHDLYFFADTDEMLQGEVVPPGIFLKAAEVLRRQMFAFCLDDWVGSGIPDTALPDKTQEALNARDSLDQTRFPYTFLEYILAHEERLLRASWRCWGQTSMIGSRVACAASCRATTRRCACAFA